MSVLLDENEYKIIRNNDPSYQAMTRVSDANNIYDIKQRYIKNKIRNDFTEPLSTWNHNKGFLNDGKYINMSNFFTETIQRLINGNNRLEGHQIPYFRFKTNAILDYRNDSRIAGTYIDKTKVENIYSLNSVETIDESGNITTVYGKDAEKTLIENTYNSFPLQRVDKLVVYDLASLFVYLNGKKLPDNEVFVYTNQSFTDVFIPMKYLGDIENNDLSFDHTITIDYRQAGTEDLYYKSTINGTQVFIDLKDPQYDYTNSMNKNVNKDNVIMFVNGYLKTPKSVSKNQDNVLIIESNELLKDAEVEIYVLNDIVYRHHSYDHRASMINPKDKKLHFYLNDDYITDVISGPITKSAVSFFYDSKRLDDFLITQTSRFSFEIDFSTFDTIDESLIDFFIEDIGWKVDDKSMKLYGDDYYLLNMLGVERSVDKMKGLKSYSVFDESKYNSHSFKKILSDNGNLFDVIKSIRKYNEIDNKISSPTSKVKELVAERPTLLRKVLEQWKIPSKKMIVIGNEKDVTMSSVTPIEDEDMQIYYKIYVNHLLISTLDYDIEREDDHDIITIHKNVFQPVNKNPDFPGFKDGVNEVEMFQYDMTHKDKCVYKDNVFGPDFEKIVEKDGSYAYVRKYRISELPFGESFVNDDLCAIERVCKNWYDSRDPEYHLMYPSKENYGYRLTKSFEVIERDAEFIKIKIKLNDYLPDHNNGTFFILTKQYNVIEEVVITNEDNSYMIDNDIAKPIYSTYVEYGYDETGKRFVKEKYDYIPYINNSEPIIQHNGREIIYGKSYTFINPATNDAAACSYLVLKSQPKVDDVFTIMFNSNKTNILIVGYDNLNIDNKYGLVYLSELKYPISPEYMNIIVNGEKLTAMDMDILSDKLVRFHHVYRPITSILITTNSKYKELEIKDYLDLYKESEFELILEDIFHNCDPSKKEDAEYPVINYIYKVNPYYEDFVGELGEDYDNEYYREYIEYIKLHKYDFDKNSIWSVIKPEPINDEEHALEHEAWLNAQKFFAIYKWNHGFVEDVDSVKQRENPEVKIEDIFESDTLVILYLNWLARSGKTRTYGFKDEDIDPIVLKYFSIYQNTIIDNRIDIVINSSTIYDGLQEDLNEPITYNWDELNPQPIYQYPGAQIDLCRRFFWGMFLKNNDIDKEVAFASNPESTNEDLFEVLSNEKKSNILYPRDFPMEPDRNGIIWTGSDIDIVNIPNIKS